jgi:hypothetical protein
VRRPIEVVVALAAGGAACAQPAAIVNKLLSDRARQTFATPADMMRAVFSGSSKVDLAFQAIVALVLLATVLVVLRGVWQMVRGADGGFELVAGGVFGLLGLTAALTVVM